MIFDIAKSLLICCCRLVSQAAVVCHYRLVSQAVFICHGPLVVISFWVPIPYFYPRDSYSGLLVAYVQEIKVKYFSKLDFAPPSDTRSEGFHGTLCAPRLDGLFFRAIKQTPCTSNSLIWHRPLTVHMHAGRDKALFLQALLRQAFQPVGGSVYQGPSRSCN